MKHISMTQPIRQALFNGATLVVSVSGGKDSQAMLNAIAAQGFANQVVAIHANVGAMEWEQTHAHCEKICSAVGVELVTVARPQGDLLAQMEARRVKLEGQNKPHWPSSAARYCTSDHKRAQIDKYLRQYNLVISAEGIRADESRERAKRCDHEAREQICTRDRTAYTWRPILNWSVDDVWEACGTSAADLTQRRHLYAAGMRDEALQGWPAHPAYVIGNERLSCAICVLASRNDITNGARHNPGLLAQLVAMEEKSGFTFRKDLALADLAL